MDCPAESTETGQSATETGPGTSETGPETSGTETETSGTESETETSESETEGEEPLPTALDLDIHATKQFGLSWPAAVDADFYRVLESPMLGAPFSQVGEDLNGLGLQLTVPLHFRTSASYRVSACNAWGCADSPAVAVAGTLVEAIGYVKALNADADDLFGRTNALALSADGRWLAVGALGEASGSQQIDGDETDDSAPSTGAVYIYEQVGGEWLQQAYLKASNAEEGDSFGFSVALSAAGNRVAVGALGEDSASAVPNFGLDNNDLWGVGAVYVFVRDGQAWTQEAYLKAANPDAGDFFGQAVSLSDGGDTLAVGAVAEDGSGVGANPSTDDLLTDSGAVYVFARDEDGWSQQAYLKSSSPAAEARLGRALALDGSGDTLAVGSETEDGDAGATYVFTRIDQVWYAQATLLASNREAGDIFGCSVSLSADGTSLAVGAWGEDGNGGVDADPSDNSELSSGAAYVYVLDGGQWAEEAYLKSVLPGPSDRMGWEVALSADGSALAVSVTREDSSSTGLLGNKWNNDAVNSGAVYVYRQLGATWQEAAYLKAPVADMDDRFGSALAINADGSVIAVGTEGEDGSGDDPTDNSAADAGAVFLF